VDWTNPSPLSSCESAITLYCATEFENDVQACTASLDLFVQCEYGSQPIEEQQAMTKGIVEGRNGKGIIYVFASGNDFSFGSDVNFEGTLNNRYVISVGAVGRDGVHSSYSIGGAALFISGPGGDFENYSNNLVAVAGGGCADGGVGTSFACPVVSGIVALILQANDNLTWRDVQGVLASTAQKIQPDDPSWVTNAAGFHHSYLYGFGLVDASAAVNAARTWANFNVELQVIGESGTVDVTIPDFPSDAVQSKVSVSTSATFVVESVTVYLDLSSSSRGDLEITLVSPQGTPSILAPGERPENSQEVERWKLTTVRAWGETANGDWTLRIMDRREGDVSTCVDRAGWSVNVTFSDGSSAELDCGAFGRLDVCSDGGESSGFYSFFIGSASGLDDPIFTDENGVSVVEACCACGGGQSASAVQDVLKSWRLAIYGHDGTSAPATPTSGKDVATDASPTNSATNGAPTAGTAPVGAPPQDAPRGTSGAAMSGFRWTVTLALALVVGHFTD
jgi:subtilisin-like proprotein convertase family protein